jgi:hypothetical protein
MDETFSADTKSIKQIELGGSERIERPPDVDAFADFLAQ